MTNTSPKDIIITTTHGTLKGQRSVSIYDDVYFSFERIPYAKPPLDNLRFRNPEPLPSWNPLILDCTQQAMKPIQKNFSTHVVEGSEDCLYLNIYVKEIDSAKPLPVMVFLHGGAFERGDATRDHNGPDYFMSHNVILVTIGYRLGPLGFLSLNDPSLAIPGNAGLKDQLSALEWIKQEICNFNGDTNNITLFGESAGAASTQYMMLTPLAQGLFHKAILQSGTVLCPWALARAENTAYRLAQVNGYEGAIDDEASILRFLEALTPEQLVQPYLLTEQENLHDCLFAFGPVVERYETEKCIIPRQPEDMLAEAWGNRIPIMIGGTSFEGLVLYGRVRLSPFLLTELQEHPEHMLPVALKRGLDLKEQQTLGGILKKLHFGDVKINMEHILNYCDFASYKVFWHPILRSLKARLRNKDSAATFLYRFDFDSPDFNHHRIKYCEQEVRGVAHVDDHSYLFYGDFAWELDVNTDEYKTIDRMVSTWTSFAKKSNPNSSKLKNIGSWQPLNVEEVFKPQSDRLVTLQCLNISHELEFMQLPELEKLQAWENIYEGAKN